MYTKLESDSTVAMKSVEARCAIGTTPQLAQKLVFCNSDLDTSTSVRYTPVRCTLMRCTPIRYAPEVHAHGVHGHEVHAREVHAREMHARDIHAHERYAREVHAYRCMPMKYILMICTPMT